MKSKLVALLACTGFITSVGAYAGTWEPIGTVNASFSVTQPSDYTVTWEPLKSVSPVEAMSGGVGMVHVTKSDGDKTRNMVTSVGVRFSDSAGKLGVLTFTDGKGKCVEMTAMDQLANGVGPVINTEQAVNTSAGEINLNDALFVIKPATQEALPAGTYSDVITVSLWNN